MSKNDITGDTISTKGPSNSYSEGWDRIFGKKKPAEVQQNKKLEPAVKVKKEPKVKK
jgi:hypothetical protein